MKLHLTFYSRFHFSKFKSYDWSKSTRISRNLKKSKYEKIKCDFKKRLDFFVSFYSIVASFITIIKN